MSQFTSFISVRIPTKEVNKFVLLDDLVYERWYEWSGNYIVVKDWFETDFASLPFIARAFFMQWDYRWILWSVLHDALWSKAKTIRDYQDANDIFYEAIQITGTPKWLAVVFYLSVSISKYYYFLKRKLQKEKDFVQ